LTPRLGSVVSEYQQSPPLIYREAATSEFHGLASFSRPTRLKLDEGWFTIALLRSHSTALQPGNSHPISRLNLRVSLKLTLIFVWPGGGDGLHHLFNAASQFTWMLEQQREIPRSPYSASQATLCTAYFKNRGTK
jgi:hypothetical protein